MRLQIGHGVPPVVIGLLLPFFGDLVLLRCTDGGCSSKFLVALMVVARYPDLLLAAVSSSFGSMPAHLRFALRLFLYLLLGRPGLRFP